MRKTSVAVVGASGYSGEELVRLLLRHPQVELSAVTSRQYAGQTVAQVFPKFAQFARARELRFTEPNSELLAKQSEIVFLALPHGVAAGGAQLSRQGLLPALTAGAGDRSGQATQDPHPSRAAPDSHLPGFARRPQPLARRPRAILLLSRWRADRCRPLAPEPPVRCTPSRSSARRRCSSESRTWSSSLPRRASRARSRRIYE